MHTEPPLFTRPATRARGTRGLHLSVPQTKGGAGGRQYNLYGPTTALLHGISLSLHASASLSFRQYGYLHVCLSERIPLAFPFRGLISARRNLCLLKMKQYHFLKTLNVPQYVRNRNYLAQDYWLFDATIHIVLGTCIPF